MAFEWLYDALSRLRGIEPHEVHEALRAQRRWPRQACDDTVGLRVVTIWARTDGGRPLIVATRQGRSWNWQCLGARDMSPAEVQLFERWELGR